MNTINTIIKNKVGLIQLSRPKQLNALNRQLMAEISQQLDEWRDNSEVCVILITGEGEKAFAAGADIKEFADYDTVSGTELSRFGQVNLFDKIEFYNKPIIAAINGYALGGGLELCLACHMRFASHNAQFGLPESTLGLIPGYGGTQRLPQIVGKTKAYEMLFTAMTIDADMALKSGLISEIFNLNELREKTQEIAEKIAQKSPLVNEKLIKCVNAFYYDDGRNGYEEEIKNFGACFATQDAKEGISAFLEKRKPTFEGS